MEKKEQNRKIETAVRVEKKEEALFYTTEEMFGTRGAMKLRWPPRHILVPLNGEKEGRRIIPFVTALAKTCKAKVTLFTVARPFQWSLATPSIPAPTTAALESRLIHFVMEMRVKGVDVDFGILRGEKKKIIEQLNKDMDADLIILDNRYRHRWLRYLKGKDIVPLIDHLNIPTVVI